MKTVGSPNDFAASARALSKAAASSSAACHQADAPPAAAGGGLDHERVADDLGLVARVVDVVHRAAAPRRHRHAGLLGEQLGGDLVAQRDASRRRLGPRNVMPRRSHRSANSACSATNPQPGHTASARGCGQRPLEQVVVEVRAGSGASGTAGGGGRRSRRPRRPRARTGPAARRGCAARSSAGRCRARRRTPAPRGSAASPPRPG